MQPSGWLTPFYPNRRCTCNLFLGDDDPVLKGYVWDMCVGIDYVWCEIRQQSYEEPATKHPSGKIAQNCWIKT